MKIIKSREDIVDGMWCRATEENFNALKNLGFDSWFHTWNEHTIEANFSETDVFLVNNKTNYITWLGYNVVESRDEFTFNQESQEPQGSLFIGTEFLEPETFKVEILKIFEGVGFVEYIGVVNENIPAKWNSEGVCLNPSKGYSLFREYKQRIYTKENVIGFNPKQKFKVSWTEKMSLGLEQSGWKLATNEEIESFK